MTTDIMQRKIFIGIDLDARIKRMASRALAPWQDLPIKWHKEDSFHIELITIGWIGESDFLRIEDVMTELSARTPAFTLNFSQIIARSKDITATNPRDMQLVQLIGEENDVLKELYNTIGKSLQIPCGQKRSFRPVVTLGRMRAQKWQELETYPEMTLSLKAEMDVSALTLFESVNMNDTWQFEPVEVFDLQ